MNVLLQFQIFFSSIASIVTSPEKMVLLFGSTLLGIIFGALPGLTATLGVALLTTLTYSLQTESAFITLIGIYVGAIYGGSYTSIMINIPGTAASAASTLDGYPMAQKGLAGKALGLCTTCSTLGTIIGMMFLVTLTPIIAVLALQFTSFEFFLLAFLGISLSGSISAPDTVQKGWLAGFFGLFLAMVGRDQLQTFPRFTMGISQLEGGIDIIAVLIGAFGIPQIIDVLVDKQSLPKMAQINKILPSFRDIGRNFKHIVRSALVGVGIGVVPGIGEDIAAWVSYGTAKRTSKHPEKFGTGAEEGLISPEIANNASIGGAMVPLLTLGIPGSPPGAMLLGALLLHGVAPGPMLEIEHPGFTLGISAMLLMASITMWILGMLLAKQVIKLLRVPSSLFMPVVGVLCLIGSYALGLKVFNLYLMLPMGIIAYLMGRFGYPIPPLVIGVILGSMADANLRRGLMVSKGSLMPFLSRPVALILVLVIVIVAVANSDLFKIISARISGKKKTNGNS